MVLAKTWLIIARLKDKYQEGKDAVRFVHRQTIASSGNLKMGTEYMEGNYVHSRL